MENIHLTCVDDMIHRMAVANKYTFRGVAGDEVIGGWTPI